ncbi:MAG: DNA repair protein RecO [Rikenellaceae bacterium]
MKGRYKGRGIVLHTLKYGDSSIIVHLLSDTLGRKSYIVHGAHGARSKGAKMALFQPLYAVEFEGVTPSKGELHRFSEVRSAVVLQRIPYDFTRSTISLFIAEVLWRLVKEEESNAELFEFAWNSLLALDSIEEGVANFHLWFLANLSRQLGFFPGNEHSDGAWFDIVDGIYTPAEPHHALKMTPLSAEIFRDLTECDIQYLAEIGLNRTQRVEILGELLRFYDYHLDSINNVRSIEVLREVF